MINIILVINHFGCENSINVTTLSEVARRMLRRKVWSHLGVASKLHVAQATCHATPV